MNAAVSMVVVSLLLCAFAALVVATRVDYEHKKAQCVATGGQWHFVGRYPECSHS